MTKRIFRVVLCVSTLSLFLGLILTLGILYQQIESQLQQELKTEASYLSVAVERDGLNFLQDLPRQSERITLISEDGNVLYDNRADVSQMENHLTREEIQQASETGVGQSIRQSDTLGEQTVYYAIRLEDGSILRISGTQSTVWGILFSLLPSILGIFFLLCFLSAFLATHASKKIVEPINNLNLEAPDENDIYDEIVPLLLKISKQQKTIRNQLFEAKQKQAEFSLITAYMEEGLLVINAKMELLSYNESALRLLHTEKVQIGDSILTLNRGEPFQHLLHTVLEGKRGEILLKSNGRFCQVTANPVFQDKRVAGAVLLLVDITEQRERETLRREFTANVSHELKTPLTSISGFAEILRDGLVRPEDIQKFAGRIFDESQRLITLIGDIIKISRLDEGDLPYEPESVNLRQMAKEILNRLHPLAEDSKITLSVIGEAISLKTVKPILEEILYNLCSNAIKYNRPGGKVIVESGHDQIGVFLRVSDTGIGISAADQVRIFERFYRVDKSHSKEIGGTGLGLSIVKHGAAYLGAEITVESAPNEGSTFTLHWNYEKSDG